MSGEGSRRPFVPALGHAALTPFYDPVVALVTREKKWREAALAVLDAQAGESIIDFGCGTGAFAAWLAQRVPDARLTALDPDPAILARARLRLAGHPVSFLEGFIEDHVGALRARPFDKAISGLVFHQVPVAGKATAMAGLFAVLKPGGRLVIADYGVPRDALQRALFLGVQLMDGFAATAFNARGALALLMVETGFVDVVETARLRTLSGTIAVLAARRP